MNGVHATSSIHQLHTLSEIIMLYSSDHSFDTKQSQNHHRLHLSTLQTPPCAKDSFSNCYKISPTLEHSSRFPSNSIAPSTSYTISTPMSQSTSHSSTHDTAAANIDPNGEPLAAAWSNVQYPPTPGYAKYPQPLFPPSHASQKPNLEYESTYQTGTGSSSSYVTYKHGTNISTSSAPTPYGYQNQNSKHNGYQQPQYQTQVHYSSYPGAYQVHPLSPSPQYQMFPQTPNMNAIQAPTQQNLQPQRHQQQKPETQYRPFVASSASAPTSITNDHNNSKANTYANIGTGNAPKLVQPLSDISTLVPIPGYMAYHHPLIPIIPSASGNTGKYHQQRQMQMQMQQNMNVQIPPQHPMHLQYPVSMKTLPVSVARVHSNSNESICSEVANEEDNNDEIIETRRMAFGSPTWSAKDDELLRYLKEVEKIGWRDISMYFPSRTINACQFRWRRLILKEENKKKREDRKNKIRQKLASGDLDLGIEIEKQEKAEEV